MTPKQLKSIRKKLGMTQSQFSIVTMYSVESITKMENGRMPITARAENIFKLLLTSRK